MTSGSRGLQDEPETVQSGDGTVEVTLPARMSSVKQARAVVHQRWSTLDDHTLADVELIATELVANAVLHGRPDIVFRLRCEPFAIDLEVLDHGDDLPTVNDVGTDPVPGRGLAIVDQLANRWGFERLHGEHGKVVWASVRR